MWSREGALVTSSSAALRYERHPIRWLVGSLACAVALLFVVSAGAAESASGLSLFKQGRFVEAAALGRESGTPDGLAFAARAMLAAALIEDEPTHATASIKAAVADARAALKRQPDNVQANLQLAIALGYLGAGDLPEDTNRGALAEEARRHIDRALSRDPNNPWALATLGAWHMTVVHFAGPIVAQLFYQARWSRGVKAFEKAIRLDPSNVLIRYHFAMALLLRSDDDDAKHEAVASLRRVLAAEPDDALQAKYWLRAQARLRDMHELVGVEQTSLPQVDGL